MRKVLLSLFCFAFIKSGAQPTNQDCPNAIPICNTVYSTVISYSGTGNIPNEITPGSSCLGTGENNDVWYTFTTPFFGNLNFTITPNDPNDDYDWAVYNLTTATCAQIATNPALEVSCNFAPNLGCGGTTGPNNNTGGACGGQNEPVIPVLPGQTYVINVSNYSSTQNGYTIDFSASTGSIFDIYPPTVNSLSSIACGSTSLTIVFNENVTCASVQPNDFVLTGPGGPYTVNAVASAGCASGASYSKTWTLTFSPAVSVGGPYTLSIVSPVADLCANNMVVPTGFALAVPGVNLIPAHTDVLCNGGATGTINIQTMGGIGPFSYQWSPNVSSTNSASNLAAGSYTVTVSGSAGCPGQTTVVVAQPVAMSVQNQNIVAASCGGSNGSVGVTIAGGTPPYNYLWSSGATTATASNLAAGNHTLTVTDASNCTFTQIFVVNTQSTLNAFVSAIQNVSCFGGSNGSLTIGTAGGSGAYSYQWSPNVSLLNIASNIPAGTYSVTVTDGPCSTTLSNLVIIQPASALSANPVATATTCGNANGTSIMNAAGGTPGYSYLWSPSGSGASSAGLVSGAYTVTITDANGCTLIRNFNVGSSSAPVPSVSYLQQTVTCFGSADGNATVNVVGGLAPYTFNWSGGMGTGNNKNNLAAGNYTVTVTDNLLCTASLPVTINTPVQVTAVAGSIQHVKCFGQSTGSATINAAGGTGALTYVWSPSGGNSSTANNLAASNYTVTVSDANGCTKVVNLQVNQPAAALQSIITSTATTCGNTNGVVTVLPTGGTTPYSYFWSNSGITSSINLLNAGTYTCTITDANLCTVTKTSSVASSTGVTVSNPVIQNLNCAGISTGSISLSASGGVQPYTYLWSSGGSTTNTSSNLPAGNYSVIVTDQLACTATANYVVTSPAAITINLVAQQDVSCFGGSNGSLSLNAVGGTGALTYQWSPAVGIGPVITNLIAKTYSVVVSDVYNCSSTQSYLVTQPSAALVSVLTPVNTSCGLTNGSLINVPSGGTLPYSYLWSNAATTSSIQNVPANTYTCTVTDAHGCTTLQTSVVQPSSAVVISSASSTNALCNGVANGTATVSATGGISPYTYLWSNSQTSQALSNIPAGNYSVTISDNVGCTATTSFVITQPSAMQIAMPAVQTVCKNQNTILNTTISGGTLPYQYLWSTGATTSTLTIAPVVSGSYTVTVTDSNGCIKTSAPATVNVFPNVTVTPLSDSTICENKSISCVAVASGGNGVFQYNWGAGFSSNMVFNAVFTSDSVVNLIVRDGCLLTATASFNVHVIPIPVVMFTASVDSGCKPLDVTFSDQTIAVVNSVYNWDFGDGNFSNSLPENSYQNAGSYPVSLTVTTPAPQLCTATYKLPYDIVALERPVASFIFDPEEPNILSPIVTFRNKSIYSWIYTWSFGDGEISHLENPDHSYYTIGTFKVLFTTSNNFCEDTASAVIDVTDNFSFYIPNAFSPDGDGKNELFSVYGTNITDTKVSIFNRWGQKIFDASSYPFSWNGKYNNTGSVVPQGVYMYAISAFDKFGNKHQYSGQVTVIK